MHTQLHILGVLIFMMYYVGMEIRQPISTEAQIGVGYHTLLGSHGGGRRGDPKTQPSLVSFHKGHWQCVRERKTTVFRRWLMGYEGFPLQHNETLVNTMSGQWWRIFFYQAYKHIAFWTSIFTLVMILNHRNEIQPCWGLRLITFLTPFSCTYLYSIFALKTG